MRRRNKLLSAGGSWLLRPEYDDYAIVLDFERNRYAMPALDGSDDPILTRDEEGRFPKREVSFSDAMAVTRYTVAPEDYVGDFPASPMYTFDGTSWSLIGGDGLGINVPRLERWFGRRGMWVDPAIRFNRMPMSFEATYPKAVNLARGFAPGYRVSWVGNDDLVYEVTGQPGAPWSGTITARSSSPTGLNWGIIPQITEGYDNELTIIRPAGNPGTVFDYVNMDTFTNEYYPATTAILTDDTFGVDDAHQERAPEHVRVSAAIAAILNRGDSYPRAGTFVLETQQTMEPLAGNRRTVMGGHPDAGIDGPAFFSFTEDSGTYRATSGSFFGDMHIPLSSVDQTTALTKFALAVDGFNSLRRFGVTGEDVLSDTGNPAFLTTPHFGMCPPSSYVNTQNSGGKGGTGAYYKFMWSPDVFSEEEIATAVG